MINAMTNQRFQIGAWLGAMTLLFGLGCGEGSNEPSADDPSTFSGLEVQHQSYADSIDGPHADHHAMHSVTIFDGEAAARYFSDEGVGLFEYPDAFAQVGLRLEAATVEDLSFRAQDAHGDWSDWQEVDIYWSEERLHNGLILIDTPTTALELRGGESIEFAQIEFFPEVIARQELIRNGDEILTEPTTGDDIRSTQQAVAPSSLVTSRAQWSATNPNKICGSVVNPYRMSIHHTAVPSSDGNLYATMRKMQNYHMNNNNWCDIGYHFVVAQSGEILQGRSRSNRPGAHVGGQNSGNVGISLIGNYTSSNPPQAQINSAGDIVRWVHDTHGVGLNRTAIKKHHK